MSCPNCFRGTAKDAKPTGSLTKLHGLQVYLATPPTSNSIPTSTSKIIFFPDAFGLHFINNQLLADSLSINTGMPVIIPDVIPGTGMTTAILPIMDVALGKVAWWDILGWMKKIVAFMRFLGMGVPFMLKADAGKVMPEIVRWVRKVRSDLEAEGKLGVAGYCWGGRVSTDLCNFAASDEEGEEGKRLVDAQFCAHPSRIPSPSSTIPTAVSKFNAPYSIAVAEHDGRFDFKIADEIEVKLREKLGDGIGEDGNWEVKGYKGCAHGFAVRASPGNDVEMQAAEEACKQASEWFRKWL